MSQRDRLHRLVDSFPGRRVVMYGDCVLDRFVLGTPKRISREAPVIILRFEEQRDVPGGGANAAANVTSLGGTVVPVAFVGEDEPGRKLLSLLAQRGVDVSSIVVVPDFSTVTKVRILAGGPSSLKHQIARYDIEDSVASGGAWRDRMYERLEQVARTADAAVVSDYGYGSVTRTGVARLRAALPAGAMAVADSRFALRELGPVDGATPNLEELAALADGRRLDADEDVAAAASDLRQRLEARFVVATRGSRGLTVVTADGAPLHLPVYGTDQVADVTGAGDTVLATLSLALAAGAEPADAARLANLAGGIVVMKLGTATVAPDELHAAIDTAERADG